MDAKQAKNGNWFINIVAHPNNDEWSDVIKYRMFVPEALKNKLIAKQPKTIDLEKVKVDVTPFQRVNENDEIMPTVYTTLTVVCRMAGTTRVDDAEKLATQMWKSLESEGKLCAVTVDPFDGAVGDNEDLPV